MAEDKMVTIHLSTGVDACSSTVCVDGIEMTSWKRLRYTEQQGWMWPTVCVDGGLLLLRARLPRCGRFH